MNWVLTGLKQTSGTTLISQFVCLAFQEVLFYERSHFTSAVSSGSKHVTGCKAFQSLGKAAGWLMKGKAAFKGWGQRSVTLPKNKSLQTDFFNQVEYQIAS